MKSVQRHGVRVFQFTVSLNQNKSIYIYLNQKFLLFLSRRDFFLTKVNSRILSSKVVDQKRICPDRIAKFN